MPTQVGHVDGRRRPLVRVELGGTADDILALMDTGFNGELLLTAEDAVRLGFTRRDGTSYAQLASGQSVSVQRARGTILWLGRTRRVEALATSEEVSTRHVDDPVALVGTQLLSPHLVLIDFRAGTIEIEEVD